MSHYGGGGGYSNNTMGAIAAPTSGGGGGYGGYRSSAPSSAAAAAAGPRAKCDQVVFEALCKACEVIVGSRARQQHNGTSRQQQQVPVGSTRFNLQVPEIAGVRSILGQYRQQLHVPVRLDVYYQHPDGRRELLERWCLEYRQSYTDEPFFRTEHLSSASGDDPIAQLRHVCKRVVIWLRCLYCWTRLLPAQAFQRLSADGRSGSSQIGFSIYANQAGNDDVTDLTQHQGFLYRGRQAAAPQVMMGVQAVPGSTVVTTPYGELDWKVLYSSAAALEPLLPRTVTVRSPPTVRIQTAPRPIPVTTKEEKKRRESYYAVVRSAPSQVAAPVQQWNQTEQRPAASRTVSVAATAATYTERSQQRHAAMQRLSREFHKAETSPVELKDMSPSSMPKPALQRRHTSLGVQQPKNGSTGVEDNKPPERVLSGLSLALLQASDEMINGDATKTNGAEGGDADKTSLLASPEQRRAALHQMPPHFRLEQHGTPSPQGLAAAMSGDYGYAYNNHIPWQKIHPSTTTPVEERALSSSLTSLAATPPPLGGVFQGTPSSNVSMAHLIPPRSLGGVTPPFQPRPLGFMHEPVNAEVTHQPLHEEREELKDVAATQQPPVASLDVLRNSPFQSSHKHPDSRSQMSSVSFAPGVGGTESHVPHDTSTLFSGNSDLFRRSLWTGTSMETLPIYEEDDGYEEMPFAVELPSPKGEPYKGSESLANSAALASLAQKCSAPSHRLKLFESQHTGERQHQDDLVSSLADQLQEFRSFGATLSVSAVAESSLHGGAGTGSSSSTSTPISLRT